MSYDISIVGNHLGWIPLQNVVGWNVWTKCRNVRLFKGDQEKIRGWEKITPTVAIAGEIRLIFYFLNSDGTKEHTYIITSTNAYRFTPPTTILDITDVAFGANTERINGA